MIIVPSHPRRPRRSPACCRRTSRRGADEPGSGTPQTSKVRGGIRAARVCHRLAMIPIISREPRAFSLNHHVLWTVTALGLAASGFALGAVLCGLVRRLAPRWGLIDRPGGHKAHREPTPLG